MIEKCYPCYVNVATLSYYSRRQRYISEKLEADLLRTYNVCLLPTRRKNQKAQYPPRFRKQHAKLRRRIETTISQTHPSVQCFTDNAPGIIGGFAHA